MMEGIAMNAGILLAVRCLQSVAKTKHIVFSALTI